jgi:anti-anti-sigma factor
VQHEIVEEGERNLILDFTGISECDSYGISELLRLHRSIQNIGGKMVLACLNDLMVKVFSITKVDTVFHIARTIPQALELFPGVDLKPA